MKTLRTEIIPLDQIFITTLQSREEYDKEEIKELAETLKTCGQLQNGVGREAENGKIELFIGCRRFLATVEAGLPGYEVKIVEATDQEVLRGNLVENAQRVGLKPLEEAGAIQRLMQLRDASGALVYSERSLAQEIGKPHNLVHQCLSLLKAPESVRERVNKKEVSLYIGAMIGSLPESLHAFAVREVVERAQGPMAKNESEAWFSKHCRRDLRRAKFNQDDKNLIEGVGACKDCLLWGGNRDDLEGKNKIHVCLGPDCFERKQAVAALMAFDDEGFANVVMMNPAIALPLFDSETNELRPEAAFVDLCKRPDPVWLEGGNKDKAPLWRSILSDTGIQVYAALDHAGTVRHLADLQPALAAARMEGNPHHVIFKPAPANSGSGDSGAGETGEGRREKLRLDNAEKAGRDKMLTGALSGFAFAAKTANWTAEQWGALLSLLIAPLLPDDFEMLQLALGYDVREGIPPEFETSGQFMASLVMLIVIHEARFYGMESGKIKALSPLLEFDREMWAKEIDDAGKRARKAAAEEGPKKKVKKSGSRSEAADRNAASVDAGERDASGKVEVASVAALPPAASPENAVERKFFLDLGNGHPVEVVSVEQGDGSVMIESAPSLLPPSAEMVVVMDGDSAKQIGEACAAPNVPPADAPKAKPKKKKTSLQDILAKPATTTKPVKKAAKKSAVKTAKAKGGKK